MTSSGNREVTLKIFIFLITEPLVSFLLADKQIKS